jgi:DnaJ-class molecular chaperone
MTHKEEPFVLYKILGVPKEASDEEIRKQFKVMAFKFHPD